MHKIICIYKLNKRLENTICIFIIYGFINLFKIKMQLYFIKNIYLYTFIYCIYTVNVHRIMNNLSNLIKLEYYYIRIKIKL